LERTFISSLKADPNIGKKSNVLKCSGMFDVAKIQKAKSNLRKLYLKDREVDAELYQISNL
jgi:hypothetical protein